MYLKFSLPFLFGSSLLLLVACQNVPSQDQKLIAKVEAEIQHWQNDLGHYEAIGTQLENFQKEVDAAIPSLPGTPADSLKIQANAMVTKKRAAIATYKESITTLTNRLAEYRVGTATKEALEIEIKAIRASLGNMAGTFGILETEQERRRQQFSARQK